jgi:hypothetical protein
MDEKPVVPGGPSTLGHVVLHFPLTFHFADGRTETRQFVGRIDSVKRIETPPTKETDHDHHSS